MRAENAAASASRSASRAASSSASTRPAIAAKARRRLRSARLSYADIQVRAAGRASPPTPRSNRRAGSPANGRGALALRRLEIDEGGSGPACGISPCGHGRSVTPELRRPSLICRSLCGANDERRPVYCSHSRCQTAGPLCPVPLGAINLEGTFVLGQSGRLNPGCAPLFLLELKRVWRSFRRSSGGMNSLLTGKITGNFITPPTA